MPTRTLPNKTVERLSQYRRTLLNCLAKGKEFIFSHELAEMQLITPVQVRRDMMLIGYTGSLRQGYNVKDLAELIGEILDSKNGERVAVVGVGNLGQAIIGYFNGKRSKLSICAAFDINPEKIGKTFSDVLCYSQDQLEEIVRRENISIAVLTVPADAAPELVQKLSNAGIKGFLNFTPKPLQVPKHVHLEEYDIITSLEKLSYFVKKSK